MGIVNACGVPRDRARTGPRTFFILSCPLLIMHIPEILALVMITVLLPAAFSGCLMQPGTELGEVPTPSPAGLPSPHGTAVGVEVEVAAGPANMTLTFLSGGEFWAGDRILLAGTTNLSPGNHLLVEVIPVSFGPTRKGEQVAVSGSSGVVEVVAGKNGLPNAWSFTIDTRGWEPDEYLVRVQGIEVPASLLTSRFTLRP